MCIVLQFLVDRISGSAYATVFRPSVSLSVVCLWHTYCENEKRNGLWGIEWSCDRWRQL